MIASISPQDILGRLCAGLIISFTLGCQIGFNPPPEESSESVSRLESAARITEPEENTVGREGLIIVGACAENHNVEISGSGVLEPLEVPCLSGEFAARIHFSAGDGVKEVTVRQKIGDKQGVAFSRKFLRDGTAAVLEITGPPENTATQGQLRLQGLCEDGMPLQIFETGTGSAATLSCLQGQFSFDFSLSEGDGSKTVTVRQFDGFGNPRSENRVFIRDTQAPMISITAPASGHSVNGGLALTGTCEAGLTLEIGGAGLSSPIRQICQSGTFQAELLLAPGDGNKSITVEQEDSAGNRALVTRSFLLDTKAPILRITDPAANSEAKDGVTLTGQCESGLPVSISGAGVSQASSTPCTNSAFTALVSFSSGDGIKNILVHQTDTAGNQASDSRSFLRDSTTPIVTITAPAPNAAARTGLTLQGTCENGFGVTLAGSGLDRSQSVSCTMGLYSAAVTFSPGDGNKEVRASQTDRVGNTATVTRTFIKDTVSPLVKITAPAAGTVAENGVTLQGTCESNLLVEVSGSGVAAPVSQLCQNGTFSLSLNFSANDGSKSVTAMQTDAAGNTGSENRSFTRTSTGPMIVITEPAAGTPAQQGVTLKGICQTGLSVSLTGSGLASPSSTTCTNGAFSVALTFSDGDGSKNIIVSQTNAINKTGSDSRSFVKDTTPPVLSLTSPTAGASAQSGLTVQGTCESGLPVQLAGSGISQTFSVACNGGAWSAQITFSPNDGSKELQVTQTDALGNSSTVTRSFMRDTIAPALTIESPLAGAFVQTDIVLVGSCETGRAVEGGGTGLSSAVSLLCSAGRYSLNARLTSGDGPKAVTLSQTDEAGNRATQTVNMVLDTTAPVVAFTQPTAGSFVQDSLSVSGTCESGRTVRLGGSGLAAESNTPCLNGTFSATVGISSGDGSKSVTLSQTDAAGNTGTSHRSFERDSSPPQLTITSPEDGAATRAELTLLGSCESGLAVEATGSGLAQTQSVLCASGTYSLPVSLAGEDGIKAIIVSQTDAAANRTNVTRSFVKDTTAPVVLITEPALNASVGASFTLRGTCEIPYLVRVGGSGVASATAQACTTGSFAVEVGLTDAEGRKEIAVSQTDSAMNTGVHNRTVTRRAESTTPELNGSILYVSHCASCHGDLSVSTKRNRTSLDIKMAIVQVPDMSGIQLTDAEIEAVALALADSVTVASVNSPPSTPPKSSGHDAVSTDEALAAELTALSLSEPLLIAVSAAGTELALATASRLEARADLLLTGDLNAPNSDSNLLIGAVTEEADHSLNQNANEFSAAVLAEQIDAAALNLQNQRRTHAPDLAFPSLRDQIVVLVDRELLSADRLLAAVKAARREGATRVIVAVPVAQIKEIERLKLLADDILALETLQEGQTGSSDGTSVSTWTLEEAFAAIRAARGS